MENVDTKLEYLYLWMIDNAKRHKSLGCEVNISEISPYPEKRSRFIDIDNKDFIGTLCLWDSGELDVVVYNSKLKASSDPMINITSKVSNLTELYCELKTFENGLGLPD